MSHSVNVSPEARAKDAAFLQERAASGKEKYIVRHSKQARLTHGITVIACILLAISGLFVFLFLHRKKERAPAYNQFQDNSVFEKEPELPGISYSYQGVRVLGEPALFSFRE